MIIGFSGHRPTNLGGYKIPNPTYDYVVSRTTEALKELKPNKIITGMAIGYDQWVAEIAIKLNIPFIAAVPFLGQELLWPKSSQEYYQKLLAHAERVEIVSRGAYASWKMQARNKWIVDNSNSMIVAYNQNIKIGGTFNCVSEIQEQKKPLIIIDPTNA